MRSLIFYDHLGMSADLIEYLIESCVENGHKSIHYIQKVALSWADSGNHYQRAGKTAIPAVITKTATLF